MATFANIGLSQPASSTITHQLDAVVMDRGAGSTVLREVMVLGSPETTNALAAVLATAPASTAFGLVVRPLPVSVFQSTAADLNVTVAGYVAPSTTVTVNGNVSSNSSAYLPVRLTNGTAFITPATDYADASTASNIAGPTLTYDNGSNATMRAVSLTLGFPVRITQQGPQSVTTVVTSSNSTVVLPLVSSVAAQAVKVLGYFVGCSTSGNVSTLVFMSSLVGDLWAVTLSSGVYGANLANPLYLFKTAAQCALNCRIESASTAITARVSLSYMQEP